VGTTETRRHRGAQRKGAKRRKERKEEKRRNWRVVAVALYLWSSSLLLFSFLLF
jgi:hypothetical protein